MVLSIKLFIWPQFYHVLEYSVLWKSLFLSLDHSALIWTSFSIFIYLVSLQFIEGGTEKTDITSSEDELEEQGQAETESDASIVQNMDLLKLEDQVLPSLANIESANVLNDKKEF